MFTVHSTGGADGGNLLPQYYSATTTRPGAADASPQLSWSGAPPATRSYAVTIFDPDAAQGAGFWHWLVVGIPQDVDHLDEDAGQKDGSGLPEGARHLPNGAGVSAFIGAAPPAGDPPHRYVITVYALEAEQVAAPADAAPAAVAELLDTHTLEHARLILHGSTT